eukprot:9500981-Pyramimonas_sp.AAC.1
MTRQNEDAHQIISLLPPSLKIPIGAPGHLSPRFLLLFGLSPGQTQSAVCSAMAAPAAPAQVSGIGAAGGGGDGASASFDSMEQQDEDVDATELWGLPASTAEAAGESGSGSGVAASLRPDAAARGVPKKKPSEIVGPLA